MDIYVPNTKPIPSTADVVKVEKNRLFMFESVTSLPEKVMNGMRYFEIEEQPDGTCIVCDGEVVGGILGVVSAKAMRNNLFKGLQISKDKYIFTAVTCGGMEIATHSTLRKILAKKGNKVSASFTFNYPANNQTSYAPVSETQIQAMELIAKAAGETMMPKNSDSNYIVSNVCNGCGICSRVCPALNIKMVEERPKWQHTCERCTACMQLCPNRAIEFGNASKQWGRYKNPNITVKELLIR